MLCYLHMKGPDYIRRLLSRKKRRDLGSTNATHRMQVLGNIVKSEKGVSESSAKDGITRGGESKEIEVESKGEMIVEGESKEIEVESKGEMIVEGEGEENESDREKSENKFEVEMEGEDEEGEDDESSDSGISSEEDADDFDEEEAGVEFKKMSILAEETTQNDFDYKKLILQFDEEADSQ
jgi:hypothetical protein